MNNVNSCDENCYLCRNIDKQHWSAVKKNLIALFTNNPVFKDTIKEVMNIKQHRNIVSFSDPPEAILDILPSYYSRELVLLSQNEQFYFSLTFLKGGNVLPDE